VFQLVARRATDWRHASIHHFLSLRQILFIPHSRRTQEHDKRDALQYGLFNNGRENHKKTRRAEIRSPHIPNIKQGSKTTGHDMAYIVQWPNGVAYYLHKPTRKLSQTQRFERRTFTSTLRARASFCHPIHSSGIFLF
jgi:hypothetical protein